MSTTRFILAGSATAMMGGAYLFLGFGMAIGAERGQGGTLLLVGALWGLLVLALMRLFPIARWALPVAGMMVGPLPLLLLTQREPVDERGGVLMLGASCGMLLGLLEWARLSRREARRRREG